MFHSSLRSISLSSLLLLSACASAPVAGGAATAATPSTGYGFTIAPMTIVPPASGGNGFVPTALAADGTAAAGTDRFGRIEATRVVNATGAVVLQLNPDGTLSMPWTTAPDAPQFRLTREGLDATNNGRTTHLTISAAGAYSEDGVATGASVAPYNPALRDTALLLRYLHAISFLHGMSAAAATPAHP